MWNSVTFNVQDLQNSYFLSMIMVLMVTAGDWLCRGKSHQT